MEQWGWNPSTFEAFGTVAASIAAAVALWVSLAERRGRQLDSRRRLADQVSVTARFSKNDELEHRRGFLDWVFEVTNAGPLAIRDFRLVVLVRPGGPPERNEVVQEWQRKVSPKHGFLKRLRLARTTPQMLGYEVTDVVDHHFTAFCGQVPVRTNGSSVTWSFQKGWPASVAAGGSASLRTRFQRDAVVGSLEACVGLAFVDGAGQCWVGWSDGEIEPFWALPSGAMNYPTGYDDGRRRAVQRMGRRRLPRRADPPVQQ